tara:strand:- start:18 stop:392 length:375 start_codon:yes stop_codon:yes gene_type:complete
MPLALDIILLTVLFIFVVLAAFVFWLWMLIDVIKRHDNIELLIWVLVIVFLGILGALIYFFLGRKPKRLHSTKSRRVPVKKVTIKAPSPKKPVKRTIRKKVAKKPTKKKTAKKPTRKKTTRKRS